jgi:hypothetical protein
MTTATVEKAERKQGMYEVVMEQFAHAADIMNLDPASARS